MKKISSLFWMFCAELAFVIIMLVCVRANAEPRAVFDAPGAIACRMVAEETFDGANPHLRLWEARIPISMLLIDAPSATPLEIMYFLENPGGNLQVVDYSPKTSLETSVVGEVKVESRSESNHSLGVAVTGSASDWLKISGTGNQLDRRDLKEEYQTLPPLELVAASGTLKRGQGVYFKLRSSPRTTLEGSREFIVLFRTSADWQGDMLHLRCNARLQSERAAEDKNPRPGGARFLLALYAEGNPLAQLGVEEFLSSQRKLREAATASQEEIERTNSFSMARRVGALFSGPPPKIPADWCDLYVFTPEQAPADLRGRLPRPVRAALAEFERSRRDLQGLAAGEEKVQRGVGDLSGR